MRCAGTASDLGPCRMKFAHLTVPLARSVTCRMRARTSSPTCCSLLRPGPGTTARRPETTRLTRRQGRKRSASTQSRQQEVLSVTKREQEEQRELFLFQRLKKRERFTLLQSSSLHLNYVAFTRDQSGLTKAPRHDCRISTECSASLYPNP